jgi:hypothetical protein
MPQETLSFGPSPYELLASNSLPEDLRILVHLGILTAQVLKEACLHSYVMLSSLGKGPATVEGILPIHRSVIRGFKAFRALLYLRIAWDNFPPHLILELTRCQAAQIQFLDGEGHVNAYAALMKEVVELVAMFSKHADAEKQLCHEMGLDLFADSPIVIDIESLPCGVRKRMEGLDRLRAGCLFLLPYLISGFRGELAREGGDCRRLAGSG